MRTTRFWNNFRHVRSVKWFANISKLYSHPNFNWHQIYLVCRQQYFIFGFDWESLLKSIFFNVPWISLHPLNLIIHLTKSGNFGNLWTKLITKIPHYRNNSKIKYQNLGKKQNRYTSNIQMQCTRVLAFLDWHRYFNKEWRGLTSFMGPTAPPFIEMMRLCKCFSHVSI